MKKKHPCPDCRMCQWCADSRCAMCKGWLVGRAAATPCARRKDGTCRREKRK